MIILFILDNIVSNLINYDSIFYPLFTLLSLILIYPNYNKKNNRYYIISFILGLIYDITLNTLFLNVFIFLLLAYILRLIFSKIKYNYLSVLFISLLSIIYYRTVTYIMLVILNYLEFNINLLFKSIYSSILLNIIYVSLFYLLKKIIFNKK